MSVCLVFVPPYTLWRHKGDKRQCLFLPKASKDATSHLVPPSSMHQGFKTDNRHHVSESRTTFLVGSKFAKKCCFGMGSGKIPHKFGSKSANNFGRKKERTYLKKTKQTTPPNKTKNPYTFSCWHFIWTFHVQVTLLWKQDHEGLNNLKIAQNILFHAKKGLQSIQNYYVSNFFFQLTPHWEFHPVLSHLLCCHWGTMKVETTWQVQKSRARPDMDKEFVTLGWAEKVVGAGS